MAATDVIGTWRLLSVIRTTDDGRTLLDWGEHPSGSIAYGADGRMMVIILAETRPTPPDPLATDADAATLFRTMLSYGASFTVEGDVVVHNVDVAWNPAMLGRRLIRHYRLQDDRLILRTAPGRSNVTGVPGTAELTWQRVPPGSNLPY
jgi:Lipocalin-like domain